MHLGGGILAIGLEEGGRRRHKIYLGCGLLERTFLRNARGHNQMIMRRRDVSRKQVFDTGGAGKAFLHLERPLVKKWGGSI